jgi:hypothetical protein
MKARQRSLSQATEEASVTEVQVGILVLALTVGYLAASSRFMGTKICPKWWERFILSQRKQ